MKVEPKDIINLRLYQMRECRDKISLLLKNELNLKEYGFNSILETNKVILVKLNDGYFPLKCRLDESELDNIEFKELSLINITKPGYVIITDIKYASIDFIANNLDILI